MNRRRIQPKPVVELEAITLRLPAELVRAVDDYARHLGGSSDRTYVITKAIELAIGPTDDRKARSNGSNHSGSPAGLAE